MWSPIPAVAILLAAAPSSMLSAGFELAQMGSSRVDYSRAYCVSFTEKGEARPYIAARCRPGITFKVGCNRCLCRQSGNSAICTQKNCNQRIDGGECELGSINTLECNVCICSSAGRWACTRRKCRPGLRYVPCDRDMKETADAGTGPWQCTPGTSFMNGCDRCYCSNDGVSAVCRSRPCNGVVGELVPLGAVSGGAVSGGSEDDSIDCGHGEGKVYQNSTHICSICGPIILCYELPPQDGIQGPPVAVSDGSENESVDCGHDEGKVYQNGTHICSICGPSILCFELPPEDGVWSSKHQEQSASTKIIRGVSCTPGTTFMDKCNICRCRPDGKSASCTMKHCPPGSY